MPLDCQGDANQTRKYTQITLLPMNDHLTNPIPVQCHSTVTVLPIRPHHANQITLLPKKDQGDANVTKKYTHITLLPMNDHLTNPVPVYCHLTVPVLPIKPQNAKRITLLPMNDHSTNPIPIQYHLTVTVMPIRPKINDHSTNLIQIQSHCTVTV